MYLTKFTNLTKTKLHSNVFKLCIAHNSGCAQKAAHTGLVLGVYDSTESKEQELTDAGERFNAIHNGIIREILKKRGCPLPFGKIELYSGNKVPGYNHILLTGLGTKTPEKLNYQQQLNEEKENIRVAMGLGARILQDKGATVIQVDGASVPESAAEGSVLATYKYTANQTSGDKQIPSLTLFDHPDTNSWASGEISAECQNWARFLSHAPPNLKTPLLLANEIMEKMCKFDVKVDLRNKDWMIGRKMEAIISVVRSACEAPILIELGYCGADVNDKPIVMVGKGNVFDSGGLFMKPYKGIHEFRADMAGAAAILGAVLGAARKRLPINVRGVILLYQNMPSPMGLKPGDIVRDKNSTHIRVSDPDNDCRIVLSDMVNFSEYYTPGLIIDVGTFTKSVSEALGLAATGAFTSHVGLWNELQRAGLESGDRFWRLPLWKHFDKLNKGHRGVDLDNGSSPKGGDTCQAAAFLKNFVPLDSGCDCPQQIPFIHLDNFGTGLISQTDEEVEPYYRKGIKMGRPTRALIQFLYQRACLIPSSKQITSQSKNKK